MHTNGTVRYNGCAQQPTRCRHRATRPCACAVLRPPSAPHAGRHGPADSRDSAVRATLRPGGAPSAQPAPAAASRRAASEPGGTLVGVGRRVARAGRSGWSAEAVGWRPAGGERGAYLQLATAQRECNELTFTGRSYEMLVARVKQQSSRLGARVVPMGHPIPRSTGRSRRFHSRWRQQPL